MLMWSSWQKPSPHPYCLHPAPTALYFWAPPPPHGMNQLCFQAQLERQVQENLDNQNKMQAEVSSVARERDTAKDAVSR